MRRLALLIPLLATTVLIACSDETPGPQAGALGEVADSIINGTNDTTHQAVVFVELSGGYARSGTIIATSGNYAYVLTAGHCITPHTPTGVIQGDYYTSGSALYYPAVDSQAHPAYSGEGSSYDFGMIRVTGASGSTPVIPAATSPDGLHVGSVVRHVGYGLISYPNGDTDHRHYGDNTIADLYTAEFDYNQPTIGPCSGDSGGPALSTSGGEVVVGTVSRGDASCNQQGISERVAAVHDTFIQPYIDGTPIGPLTCDECTSAVTSGSGACMSQVNACYNDTDCSALLTCFNACTTNPCYQTCVNQHPSGYTIYNQIFDCVCQVGCATECAGNSMCQGGTGGSGTGGSGTGGSGTGGSGTGNTGNSGTGNSGTGASGQGAGAPGDGWVAGDTPDQKYDGTYVGSSCSVGSHSAGAGAAWMSLWAVGAGLGVAARRRRRG